MTDHESRAWETVSGWIWSCRTCLAKGFATTGSEAEEKRRKHDARPVPWWVVRVRRPLAYPNRQQTESTRGVPMTPEEPYTEMKETP